jgi:antitoxin HigA-1
VGKRIPTHPGEILSEDFLKPLRMSQYRLAQAILVPPRRINEIVKAQRGISADTALRLARFFGTSPELWMNLQARYDLLTAQAKLGRELRKVEVLAAEDRTRNLAAH